MWTRRRGLVAQRGVVYADCEFREKVPYVSGALCLGIVPHIGKRLDQALT
jgi:hypothetical protein